MTATKKEDKWKQEEANKQETMNRNIEMLRIQKQKTYKTPKLKILGQPYKGEDVSKRPLCGHLLVH